MRSRSSAKRGRAKRDVHSVQPSSVSISQATEICAISEMLPIWSERLHPCSTIGNPPRSHSDQAADPVSLYLLWAPGELISERSGRRAKRLQASAIATGRLADQPGEGLRKRRRRFIADRSSDLFNSAVGFPERLGREIDPPSRDIGQRWLTDQSRKPPRERGA